MTLPKATAFTIGDRRLEAETVELGGRWRVRIMERTDTGARIDPGKLTRHEAEALSGLLVSAAVAEALLLFNSKRNGAG